MVLVSAKCKSEMDEIIPQGRSLNAKNIRAFCRSVFPPTIMVDRRVLYFSIGIKWFPVVNLNGQAQMISGWLERQ